MCLVFLNINFFLNYYFFSCLDFLTRLELSQTRPTISLILNRDVNHHCAFMNFLFLFSFFLPCSTECNLFSPKKKIFFFPIFIEKKCFFPLSWANFLSFMHKFSFSFILIVRLMRAARASFFNPQRTAVFESFAQHPWSSQFSHVATLFLSLCSELLNRKNKKHYKI